MSVPVYLADGSSRMVDEAEAQAGIAAGRYRPQREFRYRVRLPDGRTGTIGGDDVYTSLHNGYTLATEADVDTRRAAHEVERGGPAATALAGAEGAAEAMASGATLGLSREAERALGVSPAGMRARQEIAGPAATGGEFVGALAPMLVPGAGEAEGASLLARGAEALSAPARAVTGVGDVAAGLARTGLEAVAGPAESAAGRVVRAGVEHTARGVAEGGLYGAGSAIDEDALGNEQLTADSLAAHTGMGMILGGSTSGLIGAGGRLAREASMGTLQALAPRFAESLSEGNLANELANNRAFASLHPTPSDMRQAMRRVGGVRGLGEILRQNGIIGEQWLGRPASEIEAAIREAMRTHGAEIGNVLREADARAGNMAEPVAGPAATGHPGESVDPLNWSQWDYIGRPPEPVEPGPRRSPLTGRHAGDRVPLTPENAEARYQASRPIAAEDITAAAEGLRAQPTEAAGDVATWLRDVRARLHEQPGPTRAEVTDGLAALDEHLALDERAQAPMAQRELLTHAEQRAEDRANREAVRAERGQAREEARFERSRQRLAATEERVAADERGRAGRRAVEDMRQASRDFEAARKEHEKIRREFQRVVGQRVRVDEAVGKETAYQRGVDRAARNPGRPNIGIVRAYVRKVVDKLKGGWVHTDHALAKQFQREFQPVVDRIASGQDIGLEGLHEFRSRIDKMVNWRRGEPNPLEKELRGLRRVVEAEIDHRMGLIDRSLQARYRAAKTNYGGLDLLHGMSERMAANDALHPFASVRSLMPWLGYTGLAALLHPGMAVVGLLGGALTAFSKKRGNQLLAAGLDRMAQMRALSRANAAVEADIVKSVRAALGGRVVPSTSGTGVLRRASVRASAEAYHAKVAEVRDLATNPEALAQRIGDATTGLSHIAPRTQAVLAQRAATAATFLASKIPAADSQLEGQLQPQLVRPLVPPSDRARFMRFARAVDDPMTVLDDLARGAMSLEGVETMKTVYPALYERVATEVGERVAEARTDVPYARRVQLGMLLDTATDPTMVPSYLQTVAMVTAAGDAQANAASIPRNKGQQERPLKLNMHTQPTTSGQLEERLA